jgi:hypothetical protein
MESFSYIARNVHNILVVENNLLLPSGEKRTVAYGSSDKKIWRLNNKVGGI